MAELVMDVQKATAKRDGPRITIQAQGERANSREEVFAEISVKGSGADVWVRAHPAEGFGTQMTGPFSVTGTIDGADEIKTVRVHGRNGVKSISVP